MDAEGKKILRSNQSFHRGFEDTDYGVIRLFIGMPHIPAAFRQKQSSSPPKRLKGKNANSQIDYRTARRGRC